MPRNNRHKIGHKWRNLTFNDCRVTPNYIFLTTICVIMLRDNYNELKGKTQIKHVVVYLYKRKRIRIYDVCVCVRGKREERQIFQQVVVSECPQTSVCSRRKSLILICMPWDNIDKIGYEWGYLTLQNCSVTANCKLFGNVNVIVLDNRWRT